MQAELNLYRQRQDCQYSKSVIQAWRAGHSRLLPRRDDQISPSFTRRRKSSESAWALFAMLGSFRFSKVISCKVIWAASFGLKPRVTSFLARAAKLSESANTAGSPCTVQS